MEDWNLKYELRLWDDWAEARAILVESRRLRQIIEHLLAEKARKKVQEMEQIVRLRAFRAFLKNEALTYHHIMKRFDADFPEAKPE